MGKWHIYAVINWLSGALTGLEQNWKEFFMVGGGAATENVSVSAGGLRDHPILQNDSKAVIEACLQS